MSSFVIQPANHPSLAVKDSSNRFPLRRVFCVGRNYEEHIREMGNDTREPPFFFAKPADAVIASGSAMPYPPRTKDLHHEIELVVAIGTGGAQIDVATALDHVWGAAVGIDFTRRDLQAEAKGKGRPWDMAKGFDNSAPTSALTPLADVPSLTNGRIWLEVNGTLRQEADLADMIWPVADCIADLSRYLTLAPGDLIMTGTPAGVAAVGPGDRLRGGVTGLETVDVSITE